jgi:predicted metal-binding protein
MQGTKKGPSKLITLQKDHQAVERDLKEFRQKALDFGASMAEIIPRYSKAILFALDIDPPQEFSDRSKERDAVKEWARKCFEITGMLETLAFSRGYYLAMGFSQASCIKALCGLERCLVLEGSKCPYPLKSRPSMESAGIDVYRLVTKVGWDIYPIYRSVDPKEVPRALSVGLVFIL